jgi:hypothetical protein
MSGPNLKMTFSPMTYGHKHGGARAVDMDRRDAKAEKPGRNRPSNVGEGAITKSPSNSSSANPRSGRSFIEQPQPVPHSRRGAERSAKYHKETVEASQVRPSSTKMTKSEHPKTNPGDLSLGWPASKNTTLGQR